MITESANKFANFLLDESKKYEEFASTSAGLYAATDDKKYQSEYAKYLEISKVIRELHGPACQAMHGIEREMKQG